MNICTGKTATVCESLRHCKCLVVISLMVMRLWWWKSVTALITSGLCGLGFEKTAHRLGRLVVPLNFIYIEQRIDVQSAS